MIASNADGVWDATGAVVEFELRPFLHQARWFQALVAGIVALLALGGHRFHTRRLKTRAAELARLVEERTRQLEEANQTLQRISAQDSLTGIANRRRFDEVLDLEWRRASRSATPLSLIMLDIDSFKAFNDSYGHQRGDTCLAPSAVSDVVTISLGVATVVPRDDTSPVALVAAGDQALYRAKQQGRNRVAVHEAPLA